MRTIRYVTAAALVLVLGVAVALQADEQKDKGDKKDKEVTLKGMICCTMCQLKETSECGNAIKVKEDGKDVIYYFDDKGKAEKYHDAICTDGPKKGSVTGVVTTKDKKKYIKPKKDGVKFD
jgi:hypothetical protein